MLVLATEPVSETERGKEYGHWRRSLKLKEVVEAEPTPIYIKAPIRCNLCPAAS